MGSTFYPFTKILQINVLNKLLQLRTCFYFSFRWRIFKACSGLVYIKIILKTVILPILMNLKTIMSQKAKKQKNPDQ